MTSLKQVLIVSRHGIRGPYGLDSENPTKESLETYVRNPDIDLPLSAVAWGTSETDDPREIVSPKLTKHGFQVVKRMGEYFRQHLYRDFIAETHCDKAFAYADDNQRDNLTAKAFLTGLYPSCSTLLPITNGTRLLFEQGGDPTASCPVCSRTIYEGITGANDTRYLVQDNHAEIKKFGDILECCAPRACNNASTLSTASDDSDTCSLLTIPSQWNGAFWSPWKDPLSVTDYFSEWLTLQALNNMTIPSPLTFKKILDLARVHEAHMDLVTNEVNSANFGATILAHLTASMEQAATGKKVPVAAGDPQLLQSLDNRFLYYAGHDINIMYIRNILRLQWYSSQWHPHEPTPGGMIVFELHSAEQDNTTASVRVQRQLEQQASSAKSDPYYIKTFFVTASPQQMRNAETLTADNPPDVVPVMIPLCSQDVELPNGRVEVRCPFSTFQALIGRTLKHACVADSLRPYIDSLPSSGDASRTDQFPSTALWVLICIASSLIVALGMSMRMRRRARRAVPPQQAKKYGAVPQAVSTNLQSKSADDSEDADATAAVDESNATQATEQAV